MPYNSEEERLFNNPGLAAALGLSSGGGSVQHGSLLRTVAAKNNAGLLISDAPLKHRDDFDVSYGKDSRRSSGLMNAYDLYNVSVGPDKVNILPPFKNSLMAQFSPDTGCLVLPSSSQAATTTADPQLIIPINSNTDYIPTFMVPAVKKSEDEVDVKKKDKQSVDPQVVDAVKLVNQPSQRDFSNEEIVNDSASDTTKRMTVTTAGGGSNDAAAAHGSGSTSGTTHTSTVIIGDQSTATEISDNSSNLPVDVPLDKDLQPCTAPPAKEKTNMGSGGGGGLLGIFKRRTSETLDRNPFMNK